MNLLIRFIQIEKKSKIKTKTHNSKNNNIALGNTCKYKFFLFFINQNFNIFVLYAY